MWGREKENSVDHHRGHYRDYRDWQCWVVCSKSAPPAIDQLKSQRDDVRKSYGIFGSLDDGWELIRSGSTQFRRGRPAENGQYGPEEVGSAADFEAHQDQGGRCLLHVES